jgi:hypothetical protein
MQMQKSTLPVALLGIALGVAVGAQGAPMLVASDGFGDGDRNNDGTPEGAVTNASDVGLAWYKARATSVAVGVVNDADDSNATNGIEINSGNALDYVVSSSTSNRPVLANFGMQNLADGQMLIVSFDWRITNVATVGTGDRGIRFGIYNSGGTPISSDQSSSTLADDNKGYLFRSDAGIAAGNSADFQYNTTQLGGGTLFSLGATTADANWAMDDNDSHHMVASLTRQGNDILVSVQMDSLTPLTGTHLSTAATPATIYGFDELIFTQNSTDVDFRVDNIRIETDFVPEPASLAAVALLSCLSCRRRV